MKKFITLLLVLLCCVSTVFAIDIDEGPKQTEISYNVEETYDWIVPARNELSLENSTQFSGDVIVNRCIIAPNKQLIISLDDADGVNDMLLEHGKEKLAYEVSKTSSGTVLLAGDEILKVVSGELATSGNGSTKTQSLYGRVSGKPKVAGTYEDILTFMAEVVTKEELYRWELIPSWDAYTGLYDYLGNLVGESSTERSFDVEGYFLDSGEKFNSLRISCHGAIGLETYNNNEYLNMSLFETMGDDASYAPEDFGPIVVTGGDDAEDEALLHILNWVGKLTLPGDITDLSGYKWIGNETLKPFSDTNGDYRFKLNMFATDGSCYGSELEFWIDLPNSWYLNPTGLDLYCKGEGCMNEGWSEYRPDGENRTIVIVDGEDATNPDLIEWFKENGTLIPYSEDLVKDITGYTWHAKDTLSMGDHDYFSYGVNAYADRGYGGVESVSAIYADKTEDGWYFGGDGYNPGFDGFYKDGVWLEPSSKTIEFRMPEKTDAYYYREQVLATYRNPEFISWLQANGTLVATAAMPEKGDVITIEGDDYVVLGVNGTEAKIMVKEPVFSGDMTIDGMAVAEPFDGGKLGIKYKDSNLDVFLENSFYPSLSENIKNAIIEKEITQDMRSNIKKEGEVAAVSYKKVDSTLVGKRHVYAVSIEDILGYLGLDDSAIFDMNEQDLSLNFPSRMKKEIFINATDYEVYYLRDSSEKNHYLLSLSKLPTQDKAGITSLYPYLQTTFAEFVINLAKVNWE